MGKLLNDAQRLRYLQDGFAFPFNVLTEDEVGQYRHDCDALEMHLGGKPRTIEVRQMHLHFPWAYRLATHSRVLDAVEDLLGPDLLVWATELFAKHPNDGAVSIGWHRDLPYMGVHGDLTTTAWIALSPSKSANGCMRVVLEPDRRENLAHDRTPEISNTEDTNEAIVDVVLGAGQMSLHDAYVLHGSRPNMSEQKRVGFAIRFITPQARPSHGRPPVILARGQDIENHFQVVEPPIGTPIDRAISEMKVSATLLLDTMLYNLKIAGIE